MTLPGKSEIVVLKDNNWLSRQKIAGRVVAKAHNEIYSCVKGMAGGLTPHHLNDLAESIIRNNNCTPTFLNYRGFPSSICVSINQELVHGSGLRDILFKDGDVIKIDIGATFEGSIADCAVTYVYGKIKSPEIGRGLISCQNALYDAIGLVEPGKRIGELGKAIWERAKKDGFGVITDFGGHGIDYDKLHAPPFIPNKASSSDGVTIQPGMSIAIEPMFVIGQNIKTKLLSDKWTVITRDIGYHFEHSITLDNNGNCHIITEHGIKAKDFV
jgi:methionyl aminopeptidase